MITLDTPKWYENVFVIIGFLILAEAFRNVIPSWDMLRMVFFVGVLGLCVLHVKRILPVVIKTPLILLLVGWAALSYLWSQDPGGTLSRSFALIILTAFASYVAARFTIRQQLVLLAWMIGISLIFSLVFVFALPTYGLQQDLGGVWRGVFQHKNTLGRVMAVCALIALTYPGERFSTNLLRFVSYIVSVFVILMADSMTALVIVILITVLFYTYRLIRVGTLPVIILTFASAVPLIIFLYLLLTVDTDAILISMGRNPTLSGRTEVWDKVNFAISQTPYFGYGYGAFWYNWDGMYGELWTSNSNWTPGSAHNAYLDLRVQLGPLAVFIYIVSTIIMFIQSLILIRRTESVAGLWPIMYLSFLTILSFSEDFILFNSIAWVLYMTLAFTFSAQEPEVMESADPVIVLNTPEEGKPSILGV